ncbi:MAG: outer membrane beta-barrel family protein, partial [Prevotellaceae bacterium]|nr:outer membrane beta-barrel family protein [Prevotellaceae bacterium]
KLGKNRLSAGLRHTQAYSDNTYRNGHDTEFGASQTETNMQQGETYLYGEWKGSIKKLDYMLGAGVTRVAFRQENAGNDYSRYIFNPRLTLSLPLSGRSSIRLKSSILNKTPSLSELSAVEQMIDSLQIQRGNPNLKPYLSSFSELNCEWRKGIFYTVLTGIYEHSFSPVMDEKFWEGNRIIQTWNNQQSWQRISTGIHLRIGPVKDILTLSINGGVNHYISHGNTYRHVYTNPYANIMLNGNYKNFQASFSWNTNWDYLFGETMNGGESIHTMSVGYKYRDMKFEIAVFCPFVNDFRRDTENRSKHASYRKTLYSNDISRLVSFRYSYNFSFGRKFEAGGKRLDNADNDAGVMNAGK